MVKAGKQYRRALGSRHRAIRRRGDHVARAVNQHAPRLAFGARPEQRHE